MAVGGTGCYALVSRSMRQDGFILIPVLWVLALVALVSAILSRTVATDVKATANMLRRAQLEVLSDGVARLAIRYGLAHTIDGGTLGAFQLDGTPNSCSVGDSVATISIQSTAGLVDLNTATIATLETLFTGIGAPQPANLAAAVVDFRDADDVVTPGGAEAAEYREAGLAHGPKNAAFATVGELDQVLGMTPELMARARPFITTSSGRQTPDVTLAAPELLAMPFPSDLANTQRTRYLRIRVSVRRLDAPRSYTREAVLLLESRVRGGFLVKSWERPGQHIGPTDQVIDAAGLSACAGSLLLVTR